MLLPCYLAKVPGPKKTRAEAGARGWEGLAGGRGRRPAGASSSAVLVAACLPNRKTSSTFSAPVLPCAPPAGRTQCGGTVGRTLASAGGPAGWPACRRHRPSPRAHRPAPQRQRPPYLWQLCRSFTASSVQAPPAASFSPDRPASGGTRHQKRTCRHVLESHRLQPRPGAADACGSVIFHGMSAALQGCHGGRAGLRLRAARLVGRRATGRGNTARAARGGGGGKTRTTKRRREACWWALVGTY
eukprot:SAG22_NODE_2771_length_2226_cov_1.772920_1_plen_244_part_00